MIAPSLPLTDQYELSMLEACAAHDMTDTAMFEPFVRKLPAHRGFTPGFGGSDAIDPAHRNAGI